jgi:DNA polymerase-1
MNNNEGYILDIETNGFLANVTKVWLIVLRSVVSGEVVKTYYPFRGDMSWMTELNEVKFLAGHNIIGYDLLVLKKLYGWECTVPVFDTMLLSQTLDYKRFPSGRHSLAEWGKFLGQNKTEFDKFDEYSQEMEDYCMQDTYVNLLAYRHLKAELAKKVERNPQFKHSLRIEHDAARFVAEAEINGWLFNVEEGKKVLELLNSKVKEIEDKITPKLFTKIKAKDKEPKEAKWIKNGNYAKSTSDWFGVDPSRGRDDCPPIGGWYSRVEVIQPDASSMDSIKEWLYSIGWKPDDWNWKRIGREFVKVSPKLTTSSLEKLGEDGMLVDELTTIRSRRDILKGWLEGITETRRIHGSCFTIATPTGRARHSNIVNVPSAKAALGKEIRSLFITEPGYKIIGADSAGNQFRALCHYLKNEEYTQLVLNGDVHTRHAEILSDIIESEVPREIAKPFIYAFLFGAGGEKLGLILTGVRNATLGKKAKDNFIKRIPGLEALIKKINKIYDETSQGGQAWIPGADGRKIYCDSKHKALNYLFQSFEAVTCKAALSYFMRKMKEEGIPYRPLIWYHDEMEVEVLEEYAEITREIAIEAFRDGGKEFGINLLDGSGKIGDNWYEVH